MYNGNISKFWSCICSIPRLNHSILQLLLKQNNDNIYMYYEVEKYTELTQIHSKAPFCAGPHHQGH